MAIDSRAVIAPGAKIAADVEIGAFTIVGPDVEIGPGTIIGPHAVISGWTRIGSGNRIFQFASIGDAPQDKKYKGEPTRVEIGDRNVFREYVTVNRGTTHDKGVTTVGSDNLFMASTHVAHDCVVGNLCVLANAATLGGWIQFRDCTFVNWQSGAITTVDTVIIGATPNNCGILLHNCGMVGWSAWGANNDKWATTNAAGAAGTGGIAGVIA